MNFNTSDPGMLWLSIVNLTLGLVCLVCVAVIGYGIVLEVAARFRMRVPLAGRLDSHSFHVPELGYTMADGGEPEEGRHPDSGTQTK